MSILNLTEVAVDRLKHLLAQDKVAHKALRVSVSTKGCSGLAYEVNYANAPEAGDEVVEQDGVTVYVAATAIMFLIGSEMDYVEEKFKSGFEFRNPNEAGRCGCGESFFVDRETLEEQQGETPKA